MIHRHGPSTRTDPFPTSVKPMLAGAGRSCRRTRRWAFEVKWDGVRAVLFVEGGRVRAQSRNDLDVTVSFPELADMGEFLGMTTCVSTARSSPSVRTAGRASPGCSTACTWRTKRGAAPSAAGPGHVRGIRPPVRRRAFAAGRAYDERRARLESLHLSGETFITTESFRDVSGRDVLAATIAEWPGGRRGQATRRRPIDPVGGTLTGSRSSRCARRRSSSAAGPTGRVSVRGSVGALLLGIPDTGDCATSARSAPASPTGRPGRPAPRPRAPGHGGQPVRRRALPACRCERGRTSCAPSWSGEVGFAEWTPAGRLRQPTWRGLRPDKTIRARS